PFPIGEEKQEVLHGGNAVAALKPNSPRPGGHGGLVLHGGNAVAALKRYQSPLLLVGRPGVLHGGNAVAALKLPSARGRCPAHTSSPRRQRRGRIEALRSWPSWLECSSSPRRQRRGRIEASVTGLMSAVGPRFSTAATPWPH